jgi:amino acid transporter
MRKGMIIAAVLALIGVGMFGFSKYISSQVSEGRHKIARGQEKVDQLNQFLEKTTKTKAVGDLLTSPAQKKIEEGAQEADYYENLAYYLKIGSILFLVSSGVAVVASISRE